MLQARPMPARPPVCGCRITSSPMAIGDNPAVATLLPNDMNNRTAAILPPAAGGSNGS